MTSARERVWSLAGDIMKSMKTSKESETQAKQLAQQMVEALAEAKKEAEEAAVLLRYPPGQYECIGCGQSEIFSEVIETFPECSNCGSHEYKGHEPDVYERKAPPPKRHNAGIYQCGQCSAINAIAEDTDELPACSFCSDGKLKKVSI